MEFPRHAGTLLQNGLLMRVFGAGHHGEFCFLPRSTWAGSGFLTAADQFPFDLF